MNCIQCGKELTGRQKRFCGRVCLNKQLNGWHNTAAKQKKKGIDKKIELIKMLGEVKCSKCGYSENLACLSFHHRDPSNKEFGIDQRKCAMYGMERLIKEAKKCDVLCMNCHTAHHNPQHKMVGPTGLEPVT